GDDASIRPNQIFALSLVTPLLSASRSRRVLSVIEAKLVTPFGLRTLSPDDPAYRGRYEGDAASRDEAYHQGTVWPWLAGPYACALVRFGGRNGRKRARAYLERLADRRNALCVGTLPELFDGDAPHVPRGAIAQAWSVGEWLRAWFEEVADEERRDPVTGGDSLDEQQDDSVVAENASDAKQGRSIDGNDAGKRRDRVHGRNAADAQREISIDGDE